MTLDISKLTDPLTGLCPAPGYGVVRLGMDLVHIPGIAQSLARHGDAFERKLFTPDERAYANAAPAQRAQRFAARFAAKEALIKAIGLAEDGVSWCELEVVREADGACRVRLHGHALALARERGLDGFLVSLSHDGEYAAAVVAALSDTKGSG